ncbi:hypothetical protein E4099_26990 [Streptomyces palmae]|uniref:Hydrolytic protein n=1 Tax=Streptomyces palmae TaxID=1701085 RepID=A0A4Z0G9R0_9ACTN|nr:hypothetical protein E4099_26990 [Streptomyces palmae]
MQVLNSGTTVEEFRFEVVGPCAAWTTVEPPSLSLYPGASDTATIKLRPPRAPETVPGETPLGLRVIPTSDPSGTVVPERTVTLLPFIEVTAELVPRSSHSPWRGRHKVAVDSRGNTPITVLLTPQPGSERTKLTFDSTELSIPPGQTKLAALEIRPTQRLWRGTPIHHPFQVVVAPKPLEGQTPYEPVVLDGTYEQQAILPSWLPRALLALALLIGMLVGLWYSVLRPTVRSAAREAITPEAVQKAVDKGNEEKQGGGEGQQNPSSGGKDPAGGGSGGSGGSSQGSGGADKPAGGSGGGSGKTGGTGGTVGAGAPTSARGQVRDAVGGGATTETVLSVPKGKTFDLTDVVVQNPQGDAGTLTVATQDGQLLNLALENFRDSDYHFVTPVEVPSEGKVTLTVSCREVGRPVKAPTPSECSESLFLGGSLRTTKN